MSGDGSRGRHHRMPLLELGLRGGGGASAGPQWQAPFATEYAGGSPARILQTAKFRKHRWDFGFSNKSRASPAGEPRLTWRRICRGDRERPQSRLSRPRPIPWPWCAANPMGQESETRTKAEGKSQTFALLNKDRIFGLPCLYSLSKAYLIKPWRAAWMKSV
jgi:hypothetical protein